MALEVSPGEKECNKSSILWFSINVANIMLDKIEEIEAGLICVLVQDAVGNVVDLKGIDNWSRMNVKASKAPTMQ